MHQTSACHWTLLLCLGFPGFVTIHQHTAMSSQDPPPRNLQIKRNLENISLRIRQADLEMQNRGFPQPGIRGNALECAQYAEQITERSLGEQAEIYAQVSDENIRQLECFSHIVGTLCPQLRSQDHDFATMAAVFSRLGTMLAGLIILTKSQRPRRALL